MIYERAMVEKEQQEEEVIDRITRLLKAISLFIAGRMTASDEAK